MAQSILKVREVFMRKFANATVPVIAVTLVILGTSSVLRAGPITIAPEMDPTSGIAAVALIAGAILVIRGRRKK